MGAYKKRKLLKAFLGSGFPLLLVSSISLITCTWAWIITNPSASLEYDSMKLVEEDKVIESVTYYQGHDYDANTGTVFFTKNGASSGALGTYDRAFPSYDRQLLIGITIASGHDSVYLFARADSDPLLQSDGTYTWANYVTASSGNLLSPIVRMKVLGTSALNEATHTDGTSCYQITYEATGFSSFISINANHGIDGFNTSISPLGETSYAISESQRTIYILVDYDEEAIDSLYSDQITNDYLRSETAVSYVADFVIAVREVAQ